MLAGLQRGSDELERQVGLSSTLKIYCSELLPIPQKKIQSRFAILRPSLLFYSVH
jgi:hypothetical protein